MSYFDHTSNDNTPNGDGFAQGSHTSFLDIGDSIGKQETAKNKACTSFTNGFSTHSSVSDEKPNIAGRKSGFLNNSILFFAVFSLWTLSFVAEFIVVEKFSAPLLRILILVMGGWAGLLLAYVSKAQARDFFRDLGLSSVLASLAGAAYVAIISYNMPVNLPLICGGMAFVSVFFAILLKERYFLTVSGMAALSWTATTFMTFTPSTLFWAFPALWIMQMALAIEFKAKIPLVLATLSGFLWAISNVATLTTTEQISGLMAICMIFLIGITYSRIGKSFQDNKIFSGLFQTNTGWVVATISALLLQDYWLMETLHFPWTILAKTPANNTSMMVLCWTFLIACSGIIALCCLLRLRAKRQTLWGGLGITAFAILLPASIIFKDQFISLTQQFGIPATPSFGLLIGGAITGLSLSMLANGLRRAKPTMMLTALTALSAEAVIVMDSLYTSPDNLILFGFAVLLMALTAGLYAHNGQINRLPQASYA